MDDQIEMPAVLIEEGTFEMYKQLMDCEIDYLYADFVKSGLNDEAFLYLDPEKDSFWRILGPLIQNQCHLLRLENYLTKKKLVKTMPQQGEPDEEISKPDQYTFFNEKENLREILKSFNVWEYFKKERETCGPLSERARKKLIKTIVEWSVQKVVWISLQDFPKMFNKISAIFPCEKMSMYFVPRSEGNKNPSGLLYNHFRRRHKELQDEIGLHKNKSRVSKKHFKKPDTEKKGDLIKNLPENIEKIREKLIYRAEPWDSIMAEWKNVYVHRRSEIKTLSPDAVLNRWPKFVHKRGIDMIESDFEVLYPVIKLKFFTEWKKWNIEIITEALARSMKKKESEESQTFSLEENSPWMDIHVLKAILYLLPGNRSKIKSSGPHRLEKLLHFIEYKENVLAKVREIASGYKTNFHPLIIVALVDSLPYRFYLSVFEGVFMFETFPAAFDILFKTFFVLDLGYPTEVKGVYLFIQRFFYEISLPDDQNINEVDKLINKLDSNRL